MNSRGVYPARPWPRSLEPPEADPSFRARYAAGDVPVLLWRERWLVLAVFVGLAALGVILALMLKTLYPAHASVLVRLGQEYVYQPRLGDAGRGSAPDVDEIVQAEAEIMQSQDLREQVVRAVGPERLAPNMAAAWRAASPGEREAIVAKIAAGLAKAIKVETAPATPIIRLTYANPDPELSARTLNTLLDDYLIYRRTILMAPTTAAALADQRRAFESRLAAADQAYEQFLASNQIGDFEADKTALSQLSGQIEQQQQQTDAQLGEKTARLAAIDSELAGLPRETALYHDADPTASAKLADLRVQREALLAKYKPDAEPVKDLEAQIAQLETAIAAGRTLTRGPERTGPNPVYQSFQTEHLELAAEVAGLRQTAAALTDEMSRLTDRRLKLAELEPRYEALNVDRDALANDVKDLTAKADESLASQGAAAAGADDVRVISRAAPPVTGVSLKKPALALALAFAAFSAVCAALIRMALRPGMPTPRSAARTLDLPVLGSAPLKQPA
jgi:uncharacterized protein involved in exopolysaccharide biosynthesis